MFSHLLTNLYPCTPQNASLYVSTSPLGQQTAQDGRKTGSIVRKLDLEGEDLTVVEWHSAGTGSCLLLSIFGQFDTKDPIFDKIYKEVSKPNPKNFNPLDPTSVNSFRLALFEMLQKQENLDKQVHVGRNIAQALLSAEGQSDLDTKCRERAQELLKERTPEGDLEGDAWRAIMKTLFNTDVIIVQQCGPTIGKEYFNSNARVVLYYSPGHYRPALSNKPARSGLSSSSNDSQQKKSSTQPPDLDNISSVSEFLGRFPCKDSNGTTYYMYNGGAYYAKRNRRVYKYTRKDQWSILASKEGSDVPTWFETSTMELEKLDWKPFPQKAFPFFCQNCGNTCWSSDRSETESIKFNINFILLLRL